MTEHISRPVTAHPELQQAWAGRITDPDASLAYFSRTLESGQLVPEDRLVALVGRASLVASSNRLAEAAALLEQAEALGLAAAAVAVRFTAGRLRFRLAASSQRIEEAVRLSAENLELARLDGSRYILGLAHTDAATASGLAQEPERALGYLREAIHLTDESDAQRFGTLINNLGMVYQQLGQLEEAAACFVQAYGVLKDKHPFDANLSLSNEGRVLAKMGDPEAGASRLREAYANFNAGGHTGYLAPTMSKIARCLEAAGQLEEAAGHHRAAMELLPHSGPVRFHGEVIEAYARFLIEQDRPAEAVVILRQALDDAPPDEGLSHRRGPAELLARALEMMGDTEGALAAYKYLLELNDKLESARSSTSLRLVTMQLDLEREQKLLEVTNRALAEANARLRSQSDDLRVLTTTDYLTGQANRRQLSIQLEKLAAGRGQFCILMLDIDDFKAINDTHGHQAGDEVLQHLGAVMSACVRDTDVTGRWGGEEFLVLLPGASLESGLAQARRLTAEIARRPWQEIRQNLHVTVSCGVIHSPGPEHDVDELVRQADALLYQAKRRGKNRVESVLG